MRNSWQEERDREEAEYMKKRSAMIEANPLIQYSTSQLKAELRRRKREGE